MIGLMGAMDAEVSLLREALDGREDVTLLGVTLHKGVLDGHEVVVAQGGVGKVNAARTTSALIAFGSSAVIFTGIAGGVAPGVHIGDVVIADDLVQHDIDVTALGRPPGELLGEPLSWHTDEAWRESARLAAESTGAKVHVGRIVSGDQFIASHEDSKRLHETFGALAAEMEGAAMAHVAARAGVPFAVIRVISDSADDDASEDFPAFLDSAASRSLNLVRALLG